MVYWTLAWVLMTFDPSHGALTYSPPVKNLEDCQRMQEIVKKRTDNSICVQVNIQRTY